MTDTAQDLRSALERSADAYDDFCQKRAAMNAARPAINATAAERALYDERYKADHEAEREHWTAAIALAQVSRPILAALAAPATYEPVGVRQDYCEKCDDSGYVQERGVQEFCDCACGYDAMDQADGKGMHAALATPARTDDAAQAVKRIEDGHADTEGEANALFEHLNCPACGGSGHIDDVAAQAGGDVAVMREAAQFLIDRLSELEWMDDGYADVMRDYFGHVEPAIGQLKSALRAIPSQEVEPAAEGDVMAMARDAAARYFENDPLDKARKAIAASIRQGGTMDYQDATQIALYAICAERRAVSGDAGAALVEAIIAAIKTDDEKHLTEADYMLDANECIDVIRTVATQAAYPTGAGEGWMPINTAPKDGSHFIARGHDWGDPKNPEHFNMAIWCEDHAEWRVHGHDDLTLAYLHSWLPSSLQHKGADQ